MAWREPFSLADALGIGQQVLAARALAEPWKLLESRYHRSRVTLWRYAAAALTADLRALTAHAGENETHFPEYETSSPLRRDSTI